MCQGSVDETVDYITRTAVSKSIEGVITCVTAIDTAATIVQISIHSCKSWVLRRYVWLLRTRAICTRTCAACGKLGYHARTSIDRRRRNQRWVRLPFDCKTKRTFPINFRHAYASGPASVVSLRKLCIHVSCAHMCTTTAHRVLCTRARDFTKDLQLPF